MFKENYSLILFKFIRLSSFIFKLPNDVKKYIYEYLKIKDIKKFIFYTRISLLTIKPELYFSNIKKVKYIKQKDKEFIASYFSGKPFIINEYNKIYKNINEEKVLENYRIDKKNKFDYDKEIFHLNNEKYYINLKSKKLSKKKFLLKKLKENKKNIVDKKGKEISLTIKKKYALIFKESKYLNSVYIKEDDEFEFQEYLYLRHQYENNNDYEYSDDYSDYTPMWDNEYYFRSRKYSFNS